MRFQTHCEINYNKRAPIYFTDHTKQEFNNVLGSYLITPIILKKLNESTYLKLKQRKKGRALL